MLLAIAATNDSDRTSGLKLSGMRKGIRAENGLRIIEVIKKYDIQRANQCCFYHEVMEWLLCSKAKRQKWRNSSYLSF